MSRYNSFSFFPWATTQLNDEECSLSYPQNHFCSSGYWLRNAHVANTILSYCLLVIQIFLFTAHDCHRLLCHYVKRAITHGRIICILHEFFSMLTHLGIDFYFLHVD